MIFLRRLDDERLTVHAPQGIGAIGIFVSHVQSDRAIGGPDSGIVELAIATRVLVASFCRIDGLMHVARVGVYQIGADVSNGLSVFVDDSGRQMRIEVVGFIDLEIQTCVAAPAIDENAWIFGRADIGRKRGHRRPFELPAPYGDSDAPCRCTGDLPVAIPICLRAYEDFAVPLPVSNSYHPAAEER